jgi:hypothetical protein
MIGIGYLDLGQLEEAVTSFERMREYAPKNTIPLKFLAVAYAELGKDQEAKKAIEPFVKSGANLRRLMHIIPKKDHELRERYANAFLKAGLPGEPGGYFKILHDQRLSDKGIRDLVFGHTVAGFDSKTGKEWRIGRTKNGEATYTCGDSSDSGKSWVENNMLCNQWKERYGGIKDCMPIFKNPEPRPGKKEEYLSIPVYGIYPFSVVD